MITSILKSFKGRHYKKFVNSAQKTVDKIKQLEKTYQSISEAALKSKTSEFKERIKEGESLETILPEAFAVVKNAARRLVGSPLTVCDTQLEWNMVHYDVQLIGGIALHQNKIAEMGTGEGKTLVSTAPLYLNALTGRNTQLVTVNDYLARRDSEWMGFLFNYLGLTVGCIQNGLNAQERRKAYLCDITYGTASEFGFDYLRDNGMASSKEEQVQRDHYFVIVDETDSILVDEARTPLIISGPVESDRELPFTKFKSKIHQLASKQLRLCNQFSTEAKKSLENDPKSIEGLEKLYQCKLGNPQNKQLARLVENGSIRKALDRFEMEMQSDFNKEQRFKLKESLFYTVEEKQNQSDLTEKGRSLLEPNNPDAFVIPDLPTRFMEIEKDSQLSEKQKKQQKEEAEQEFEISSEEIHCIGKLLLAYTIYERDKHYVVQNGKVMIVDENTGRIMPGRRWGDGLHASVEAKEGVKIEKESKTLASITIQNYFRLYDKLAGMTGTAETEAQEFYDIYKLNVAVIPPHKPCKRLDRNDVIYKSRREKMKKVIEAITEAHQKKQPVLVGTTSVEASEVFSRALRTTKIPHNILNAKYHQQEAEIIAKAGQKGAVTIATNMAGRGTDIKLGEGVESLGGLLVLGTERHESRRIDRQLRGRCARQGDAGESRFYISLEDDLMRLFANAGPISKILQNTFDEGDQLESPLLNRSIESAQKKVEQHNYSIRKRLLQYDDVLNRQREVVYVLRNDAIQSDQPKTIIFDLLREELEIRTEGIFMGSKGNSYDIQAMESFLSWLNAHFPVALKIDQIGSIQSEAFVKLISDKILEAYQQKEDLEDSASLQSLERYVVIRAIDKHWQDHLTEMEDLRRSVGLRGYGQKDPLTEYKTEAFRYFEQMMELVRVNICTGIFRSATNVAVFEGIIARLQENAQTTGPAEAIETTMMNRKSGNQSVSAPRPQPIKRSLPKIGRNEIVLIQRGRETQEVKFKKAEPMILSDGWVLVGKSVAKEKSTS